MEFRRVLFRSSQPIVRINGSLSDAQLAAVRTLTGYSAHPLSKAVTKSIAQSRSIEVSEFKEIPGQGISAVCDGHHYRIGSSPFTGTALDEEIGRGACRERGGQ